MRIGVNWGSLDQELLAQMMDENAAVQRAHGTRSQVMYQALDRLGPGLGQLGRELACEPERIIISCKVSGVQDLVPSTARWRGVATTRCTWA